MPPPLKALSPASRSRADVRNARDKVRREKRAAKPAGTKSGKKRKATTDLTEEEVPVSGGGSSSSGDEHAVARCRALETQSLESKELGLADEAARFHEWPLGLLDAYVDYLKWSQAREQKENQELKKKYGGALDLNRKEYVEAQQEVSECLDKYHTCPEHYMDLFHLCQGKFMENIAQPRNHTKLLRKAQGGL
jgi:hypothetical protein